MSTDQSILRQINKILRARKFIGPDPKLERYKRHNLEAYIEYCCERSHLIEAYVLTLQYSEELILLSVKIDKFINNTDAPKIISILKGAELIDEEFRSLFNRVNSTRSALAHKMIKDPKILENLSKVSIEGHKKDLLDLVNESEKFYLNYVKKEMHQLAKSPNVPLSDVQLKRTLMIADIIANQTAKEVNIPLDNLSKEEWGDKFKKEFDRIYKEKIANL